MIDSPAPNLCPPAPAGTPVSPAEMGAILRRHRVELLAYIDRQVPARMRRVVEPNDVLQDVYLEAFRRTAEFTVRGEASTRSWLLTIARHRVVNLVEMANAVKRGGGRPQEEPAAGSNADSDGLLSLLAQLAVYERTPSRSALAHEAAAALEGSIAKLPDDYRLAIRMRYLDGATVAETARAMGRTDRAVQMVCNRALKALRADMGTRSRYL